MQFFVWQSRVISTLLSTLIVYNNEYLINFYNENDVVLYINVYNDWLSGRRENI